MIYALKLNSGSWQSCVSLGVSIVSRTLRHAGTDILNISVLGQTISTDNTSFSYGTTLTLARFQDTDTTFTGTPEYLFTGRITDAVRSASGESEVLNVVVSGPWERLEQTAYRQEWLETEDDSVYAPHCVLYYGGWDDQNGTDIRLSTIDQIADVLECAKESSPQSFQFDSTTFPTVAHRPPFDERMNITCADAIKAALSMHPNLLLWFDHSTNPPTCKVQMRSGLTSESISLSALSSVDVKRRDDLIPPAVALAYVRTHTIDGKTYTKTDFDWAPIISGETDAQRKERLYQPGVLWGCYEMQGSNTEFAEQKYTVDPILWNSVVQNGSYAKTFFQNRCPEINGYTIDSITVDTNYAPTYPNFLIDGAVQSWQKKGVANDTFKATAVIHKSSLAPTDNGTQTTVIEKKDVELQFTAVTTDLGGSSLVQRHTGTDRKMIAYDSGELMPTGFAQALYNEWSVPQYEGGVGIINQETPSSFYLGKVLNITNGKSEWSSMNALITEVSEEFDSGNLTIHFGTGGWIDLNSRISWLRACYNRRYSWRRNLKTKGEDAESNTIGIDGVPNSEGGSPVADYQKLVLFNPSNNNSNAITLDPTLVTGESSPKVLQPRKIKVLIEDTISHQTVSADAWVLCSVPIADGGTIGSSYRIRYDTTTHQLQETQDNGTTWTMITGGQAVPESV
ncbi:MAG: hypothetical protein IJR99_06900 [Kiritimatiellae bacterium]|nr:hypothetical protein [Kiritimatiellia bacterium]